MGLECSLPPLICCLEVLWRTRGKLCQAIYQHATSDILKLLENICFHSLSEIQELFCKKRSYLGYTSRWRHHCQYWQHSKKKKGRAEKEQCVCTQTFSNKTKTNLQSQFLFLLIYLLSKESKDLLGESPLKMLTEWLGQYVQNSPGLMWVGWGW